MHLIIALIVGAIILSIAGAILEFLWDHIGTILAVIGVIVVLAYLPEIASGCSNLFQAAASSGLFEMIIVIVATVIAGIAAIAVFVVLLNRIKKAVMDLKGRKAMKWLNCVGVGKIEEYLTNKEIWNNLRASKSAIVLTDNSNYYAISTNFSGGVQRNIGGRRFVGKDDVLNICKQTLPTFDTTFFEVILQFFQGNLLIPFRTDQNQSCYVSIEFVRECERVFQTEGAALKDEMISLLKTAFPDGCLNDDYAQLSQIVLDHMVASGEAQANEWKSGECLYVAKHPQPGCKMIRREISLD